MIAYGIHRRAFFFFLGGRGWTENPQASASTFCEFNNSAQQPKMAQLKLIIQVNCKLRCYIWGNVVGTYPPHSISQAASESLLGLEIP